MFVIYLSFSDIIFGFVLASIAFKSTMFSWKNCQKNLESRSSFLCNTLGIFTLSTLLPSQASLNVLVSMTNFSRLYKFYKQFKTLDTMKLKINLQLFNSWFPSFLLSITPIILNYHFLQNIIISNNIFFSNQRVDRIVAQEELYKLA